MKNTSESSASTRHSNDLYIRMRLGDLHQMQLNHLYTEVLAHESPIGGYSEWCGMYRGAVTSIGWDFQIDDTGQLVAPKALTLCSNIMLLCKLGYDIGSEATEEACRHVISRLPWHHAALAVWRKRLH